MDPQSDPDPISVSSRLARLEGLPLRPASVRWVVDCAYAGSRPNRPLPTVEDPSASAPRLSLDPGWSLARLTGRLDRLGPLGLAERHAWWRPLDHTTAEALDALWRRAVAAGWVARRMAHEKGRTDADFLASVAFLHDLPRWALAAIGRPPTVPISGRSRVRLGRFLAERWDLPPLLGDVLCLGSGPVPPGIGHDPDGLRLIRAAVAWSRRTPWAEGPRPSDPGDGRRERLTVAVQLLTSQGFAPAGVDPAEEIRTRQMAGLLAEREAHRAELKTARTTLRSIAGPVREAGTGRDLPAAALQAHRRARAERRHLAEDLDAVVLSYRTARSDEPRRRLDALAEFAAGAAHELNNPLAVMLGRAQLLLGRVASDPESARSLRAIMAQAQRAHRMLRDLMFVARPPAPRLRPVVVPDFLRTQLDDLRALAAARQVTLTVSLPPSGPPVELDPDGFRHLVETLVTNAIEVTPPSGAVLIDLDRAGGSLRLRVEDSGPPLDPTAAEHLLNPFFCGRQAGRGLGLGLSRAARSLDRSGGRLVWRQKAGGGLVFTASLPVLAVVQANPVRTSSLERSPDEERAA